jgi:hypothetical protein
MRRMATVAAAVVLGTAILGAACAGVFFLTDREGWNKRHFDRIVPG